MREVRYQAAVVSGSRLLLLRCRLRDGTEFWAIPGGGREASESAAQCVAREVREEARVEVAVGRLLYEVAADPPDGTYRRWRTYHCTVLRGEPQPGGGDSYADFVAVRWIDLARMQDWETDLRSNPFLSPQLVRICAALGFPPVDESTART